MVRKDCNSCEITNCSNNASYNRIKLVEN